MRQKAVTPVALRKVPAIFCCTLAQRRSRSAWLLVKGIRRSSSKASTCSARTEQRIQQILGLALLAPAFARSCGRRGWWRLSGIASRQNLEIASDPFVALDGGNSAQVEETPLLARVMQIEQEVLHLGGPLLLLLLGDCRTIAHEVCSTDAVSTRHRYHSWPIGRACLARQSAARCRSRPWPAGLATHAKPDGSGSGCSSHATNAASHTRGCWSHLHAEVGWPRSVRQCTRPSEPAALVPSAASSLHCSKVLSESWHPQIAASASRVRAVGSNCPWCRYTANACRLEPYGLAR